MCIHTNMNAFTCLHHQRNKYSVDSILGGVSDRYSIKPYSCYEYFSTHFHNTIHVPFNRTCIMKLIERY